MDRTSRGFAHSPPFCYTMAVFRSGSPLQVGCVSRGSDDYVLSLKVVCKNLRHHEESSKSHDAILFGVKN
jgi:hypothetical protein